VRRSIALAFLGVLGLATAAAAGGTSVYYKLFHYQGGNWVQVYPSDPFPAGGDLPGTNRWRYDYSLYNNTAPGSINTLQAFFNSDGLLHADPPPAGVTPPAGWTPTYFAPPSGAHSWRVRFRNLGSPVPVGGAAGFYQVEFFWHDPVLPGTQPYDAQYSTGSETGQTIPDRRSTAAGASNWGALRKLYR
jgi:hypothetical protein